MVYSVNPQNNTDNYYLLDCQLNIKMLTLKSVNHVSPIWGLFPKHTTQVAKHIFGHGCHFALANIFGLFQGFIDGDHQ